MNRSRTIGLAVLLLLAGLVVGTGPAFAQGPGRGGPPGGGPPGRHGPPPLHRVLERHAQRLGLDEASIESIREVSEASRAGKRELRQRLRALHDQMRELLSQDTPDEAAVMAQAETIGQVEIEQHKHRLRSMLQIRALLTPAQRQELVRIREEERPPHKRGGRDPRRGREGGSRGPPPPPPES